MLGGCWFVASFALGCAIFVVAYGLTMPFRKAPATTAHYVITGLSLFAFATAVALISVFSIPTIVAWYRWIDA